MKIPYEFQCNVVRKLSHLDKCMMGLDMGLGKTITSLLWTILKQSFNSKINKVIIICQPIKLLDWKEEILEASFIDNPSIRIFNGKYKAKKHQHIVKKPDLDFRLTSYLTAIRPKKFADVINDCTHGNTILIIDESQYIKNYNSKIGKLSAKLSKQMKYVCLLTGDAISNGYIDFINQLRVLGIYFTVEEFKERFCIMGYKNDNNLYKTIVGYRNIDELMKYVHSVSWFVKTHEVAGQLPKQIDQTIRLRNRKFNKHHDSVLSSLSLKHKGRVFELRDGFQVYNVLRQLTNANVKFLTVEKEEVFIKDLFPNEKLEAVSDLYNDTPDSFIIYYNFNTELKTLKDFCFKFKIPFLQINGYQNDYTKMKDNIPDYKHIVLIQYQAGSWGVNLQTYSRTIYYSPTNSGINYRQSRKRTHRIGQDKPCFYYHLVMVNSIETKIYDNIKKGTSYSNKQFLEDYHDILARSSIKN